MYLRRRFHTIGLILTVQKSVRKVSQVDGRLQWYRGHLNVGVHSVTNLFKFNLTLPTSTFLRAQSFRQSIKQVFSCVVGMSGRKTASNE